FSSDFGNSVFEFFDSVRQHIGKVAAIAQPGKVTKSKGRIFFVRGGGRRKILNPKAGEQTRLSGTRLAIDDQVISLIADPNIINQVRAEDARPAADHILASEVLVVVELAEVTRE